MKAYWNEEQKSMEQGLIIIKKRLNVKGNMDKCNIEFCIWMEKIYICSLGI